MEIKRCRRGFTSLEEKGNHSGVAPIIVVESSEVEIIDLPMTANRTLAPTVIPTDLLIPMAPMDPIIPMDLMDLVIPIIPVTPMELPQLLNDITILHLLLIPRVK